MFFLEVILVFELLLVLGEFVDFLGPEVDDFLQTGVFCDEGCFVSLELEGEFPFCKCKYLISRLRRDLRLLSCCCLKFSNS